MKFWNWGPKTTCSVPNFFLQNHSTLMFIVSVMSLPNNTVSVISAEMVMVSVTVGHNIRNVSSRVHCICYVSTQYT